MNGGHYVYLHRRASDDSIFYVGKGRKKRAWCKNGRNRRWHFVSAKHGYTVQIVRRGLQETCALTLERIGISILRPSLVNVTDGGAGTCGWRHSPEARESIGAFHRGRPKNPDAIARTAAAHRGKTIPAAQREKMSLAKKGRPRRPLSEEVRRKISASHVGLKHGELARAKMRAAHPRRTGKDSPSYDHKIRAFQHEVHGAFAGTRGELILRYGLSPPCVSAVLSGKQKTVKGWSVTND